MKFTINRDVLLTPLQQIVGVIEKRQTMPILSNVLLATDGDFLILTGSDLEIQLINKVQASVSRPGTITVPARKLLDLCRYLPARADIQFEQQDRSIKITSQRSRFTLSCLPAANYPEFTQTAMNKHFVVNAGKFRKALEKTIFCMANQDVRYYLNGLMLNITSTNIKLVASDGHRLSIYEVSLENPATSEDRIILPRKGVLELARLLDNADVPVDVLYSDNNIKFECGQLIFSAKLVDAKYPDFSKVFMQTFMEPMKVNTHRLKESLTRASVLASEQYKNVTLDISNDIIHINVHNNENDEAEEEVETEYKGEDLAITFNAHYILEAVANIDSDDVELSIASNLSTCFVDDTQHKEYRFIVMPVKK